MKTPRYYKKPTRSYDKDRFLQLLTEQYTQSDSDADKIDKKILDEDIVVILFSSSTNKYNFLELGKRTNNRDSFGWRNLVSMPNPFDQIKPTSNPNFFEIKKQTDKFHFFEIGNQAIVFVNNTEEQFSRKAPECIKSPYDAFCAEQLSKFIPIHRQQIDYDSVDMENKKEKDEDEKYSKLFLENLKNIGLMFNEMTESLRELNNSSDRALEEINILKGKLNV